ncbi:unnamed protein product [Allacma fusca]|uniref:Protein male-specific lethal-3 n=1 Tax=Allacma fusca TaxID=39272 RepID=A0A8J2J0G5_9HEXA|nr:unnamed protein product [Allacma fusca]
MSFNRGVSTNSSGKYRFVEDEKVLCYEPDPTKAKVLYDSKVLQVVSRKDTRGRKSYEYLIHFQGWNSSWDRYVAEEYVLKDTVENRELQRFLNEEAQQLQQALKKKKKRPLAEAIKNIRQDRRKCMSATTPELELEESSKSEDFSDEDGDGLNDSSDEDGEDDKIEEDEEDLDSKESFPLVIPEDIKRRLENDFHYVTQEHRLVRIPASPCVAKILEDYVKYFGLRELLDWAERVRQESIAPPPVPTVAAVPISPPVVPSTKAKVPATPATVPLMVKPEEAKRDELKLVIRRINFVKEIVDGLRLMFDFLVERILVYKQEIKQFVRTRNFNMQANHDTQSHILNSLVLKCKHEFQEDVDTDKDEPPPTKRLTRTSKALSRNSDGVDDSAESGSSPRGRLLSSDSAPSSGCKKEKRSPSPDSKRRAREYTRELLNWKLIPSDVYELMPPNPSLVYGIIHLMRLFVKMPEILSKTSIPRRRLRILVQHINLLLSFVAKHDGSSDKRVLYYRNVEEEKLYEQQWAS